MAVPRRRGRRSAGSRRWRLPAAWLGLAWALLLLLPSTTLAHAQVVAVDPQDGARLPVSPTTVSLTFNEPVSLAPGGLRVVRADGSLADVGDEAIHGSMVMQPIAPLDDGWYVLAWSIVSEDGHVVHGSVTFGVGDVGTTARPSSSATPSPLEAALWLTRGLADLALLVGVGALMAWVMLGARTRRVDRLRWLCLGAAAVALAGWLAIELTDAGLEWLSSVYAQSGVARLALLLATMLLLARRPPAERAALVTSALALATLAVGGHATGSPLTSATLAIHLLAGVTWLGAAPAVAVLLWDRRVEDEHALAVVRAFSRTATLTLFVVIAGGSLSALLLTNGLEGGLTIYVWLVLAKLGVVGLAAIMGAFGRRGLSRESGRRRYQRLFLTDALLLVVVAALSSALTLVGPHQGHAGHDGHDVGAPRCSMTLGSTGAAVVADPGRAGGNRVSVTGPASTVEAVGLALEHPFGGGASTDVTLRWDAGAWTGEAVLPFTGDWTATVIVRVDTFTEQQGTCAIRIAP